MAQILASVLAVDVPMSRVKLRLTREQTKKLDDRLVRHLRDWGSRTILQLRSELLATCGPDHPDQLLLHHHRVGHRLRMMAKMNHPPVRSMANPNQKFQSGGPQQLLWYAA